MLMFKRGGRLLIDELVFRFFLFFVEKSTLPSFGFFLWCIVVVYPNPLTSASCSSLRSKESHVEICVLIEFTQDGFDL